MTEEEKAEWIDGIKEGVAFMLSSPISKMANMLLPKNMSSRLILEMKTYYAIAGTNIDSLTKKEISPEEAEFIWTNSKIFIQEELDKLFPIGESK